MSADQYVQRITPEGRISYEPMRRTHVLWDAPMWATWQAMNGDSYTKVP